jgi:hypothetical protein
VLDLDDQATATSYRVGHVDERVDARTARRQQEIVELSVRHTGDLDRHVGEAPQIRIVDAHRNAVGGEAHVHLNRARARGETSSDRCCRVLGDAGSPHVTAMADDLQGAGAWPPGVREAASAGDNVGMVRGAARRCRTHRLRCVGAPPSEMPSAESAGGTKPIAVAMTTMTKVATRVWVGMGSVLIE